MKRKVALKVLGTISAVLLCAVLVLCVLLMTGGARDTFQGALSAESYESAESAVKGFLSEQIDGNTVEARFVSYEKTGDIAEDELSALPLGEDASKVKSGEKGEVTYSVAPSTATACLADETKRQPVWVLCFGEGVYRYFVPQQSSGEALSRSYFESVFDPEKYRNCTIRESASVSYEVISGAARVYVREETKSMLYMGENAMYLESELSLWTESAQSAGGMQTEKMKMYCENSGGGVAVYLYSGGRWGSPAVMQGKLSDLFSEYQTLISPAIDHTYFEKTDTGFKLSPEKYKQYLSAVYSAIFGAVVDMNDLDGLEGEGTYMVKGGCIETETVRLSFQRADSDAQVRLAASAEEKLSAIGSTVVPRPSDLPAFGSSDGQQV